MSPALEAESFHLDHQGSLRPVPFRMRACLERAEEREGTARGRSSHPCEPSLGSATWQCALTERQFQLVIIQENDKMQTNLQMGVEFPCVIS